ncbi:hypothetical protein ACNPQM_24100 [Streptomyces sp. NPDC056231]|uniref:hypothetical protein n=1 Tax=Streptomyces sp. NPDC056231 TaxID=3345755 RepID=UPI003AADA2BF
MDAEVAISLIRMAAADLTMEPWQRPADAYLVQLGLDALMADIEAPSLPLLAGLARGEYPQARELFNLVLEELGLLPLASEDLAKARWTAARWWAGQIVACQLDPVHGAKLIFQESAAELGYPDALQPVVDLVIALDLLDDQHPDQHVRDQISSAAQDFLAIEAHRNHSR